MKSKLISALVVAAAALTSVAASAQPAQSFNPFLWEQMAAPSTRTRAEVKAEVLQVRQAAGTAPSGSAFYGATDAQQLAAPATPAAIKADNAQAAAAMVKTSQK
ncbi:MAG: hypothetical protein JWR60_2295 [Polaromonas sp.]|nr:hypothetical protein [Polaromonas sp.]